MIVSDAQVLAIKKALTRELYEYGGAFSDLVDDNFIEKELVPNLVIAVVEVLENQDDESN